MNRRAAVAGWGHALPGTRVPNAHFEATLDTSDAWITERTGIQERRIASPEETTATSSPLSFHTGPPLSPLLVGA